MRLRRTIADFFQCPALERIETMLLSYLHPTFSDPFKYFHACLLYMVVNLRGGREEGRVEFRGMWL
jgi:hypothetical protein